VCAQGVIRPGDAIECGFQVLTRTVALDRAAKIDGRMSEFVGGSLRAHAIEGIAPYLVMEPRSAFLESIGRIDQSPSERRAGRECHGQAKHRKSHDASPYAAAISRS
jgi:hypothetical protein